MSQKEKDTSAAATKPAADTPKPEADTKEHLDELLQEALEESFPASDPPALIVEK